MTIGPAKKKWNVKGIDLSKREEILLGWLWQCDDFYMFTPLSGEKREPIIYPDPKDVKDCIKLRYGRDYRYTLSACEVVF